MQRIMFGCGAGAFVLAAIMAMFTKEDMSVLFFLGVGTVVISGFTLILEEIKRIDRTEKTVNAILKEIREIKNRKEV